MIDEAFYLVTEVSAGKLAEAAGLSLSKDESSILVKSVASSEKAGPDDLTFVEKKEQLTKGESPIIAGVCFAPEGARQFYQGSCLVIETKHPRASYVKAAQLVVRQRWDWTQSVSIHPDAVIEDRAVIGPNVVIGPNAKIGSGTVIEPSAVIGGGVAIGRNCRIGPNTTISHAYLGDNVSILAGSVIGQSGFGLAESPEGLLDTPHYGRVIIQDNVSIGACVTVDRGLFDDTLIGMGSKIDNLSQIAHNVQVGAHTVMAAFAGIAGSADIGSAVMMGGRAGIADHVKIGNGARLAAGSATMKDVPAGETWMGMPAKPIKTFFREVAWLSRAASGKTKS